MRTLLTLGTSDLFHDGRDRDFAVHSARRFAQGIPKALAALAGQALASPFQADQRSGWTAKACPWKGLHPIARSLRCAARRIATACDLRDASRDRRHWDANSAISE